MTIDIITLTDKQFESLTEEQIVAVQEAQLKKNRLLLTLEKNKLDEKHRLVKRGTFISGIWEAYCNALQDSYEQEVESIATALTFYLQYTLRPEEDSSAPYLVDYSLSVMDRTKIVKDYYENTYDNPVELFNAFCEDKIAPFYLADFYKSVYDHFWAGMNKS